MGGPSDVDSFMQSWIQTAVGQLGPGIQSILHKLVAVKLFNELVQNGGGIPRSLEQVQGKPPPNWPVIDNAVEQAFANPTPVAMGGMGMGGGCNAASSMGVSPMGYGSWGGMSAMPGA